MKDDDRVGAFRPKRLPKEVVDVPIEGHWRALPPEEAEEFRRRNLAQYRRFRPFSKTMRRRFLSCTIGSAVGFAAVGWLFVQATAAVALAFLGVGLVVGVVVTWWRPADFKAGGFYALAAFVAVVLGIGASLVALFKGILAALLFSCIGIALGRVQEGRNLDQED